MQEFEIKGKTTITAELKAQVDNSPLALPPPENYQDTSLPQDFQEKQKELIQKLNQDIKGALMK